MKLITVFRSPSGTTTPFGERNWLNIVSTALLLVFSFPNFNLSYFAFISFIPLFFAIGNKTPGKAFLISYICGFIFYLGTLYWLYHVTVIGLIILCLYLALYFSIFGLIFNYFTLHPSPFTLTFIPLAWVILEYIQANISIIGFGWLSLGYSQYRNIPLIQIADFSGVYGVSFVVMMANVAAWRLVRTVAENRKQKTENRKKNPRSLLFALCSTMLILALVYSYGFFRLNEKNIAERSIKVTVIQGNIPQELKWDPEAKDMIIEKYASLTKMACFDDPDLIVWPETSFPGFFEIDKEITDKILDLAMEIKIPLLIGINTEEDGEYFNSAGLISSQGKFIDKYDKIHLVPFGEYVPFSGKFPVLHRLVLGELGEFTPGKEFKTFTLPCPEPLDFVRDKLRRGKPSVFSQTVKFSALICFEDIFPELSRRFVKNGAMFLVVLTNDAWYGRSGAAYQHAACSVFRAIENRVPIVRCANTGVSSFIDSKGRIYDSVEEKGTYLFITGYKTSEVKF